MLDKLGKTPNILILLNDQQRYERDWPADWAARHLPAMNRLKRNGLSFRNAITAACPYSSSRASLLTGTYPSQNGVFHTLAVPSDLSHAEPPPGYSQQPLIPTQPNLARMLKTAGYKVVWKGKWHLSNPVNGTSSWTADDIVYMREAYGFDDWNPFDAGNSVSNYSTLGGGDYANNDARFISGIRLSGDQTSPGAQSAVEFLRGYNPKDGPFCLVVSVVNPHDVWVAPGFSEGSGYTEGLGSELGMPVPENVDEDLSHKPSAQGVFRAGYDANTIQTFGPSKSLKLPVNRHNYVNFYAYLQTLADGHVMRVLNELDNRGLTESTLIVRVADHGEMALAHGLREKMYNAYEESIHVPLIVSNPVLFPEPKETDALVSSIDILPTLARIAGVHELYEYAFRGIDLTPVLEDPSRRVQDVVHFCYDDGYLTGDVPPYIRAIRTDTVLYAVYFNTGGTRFEYEMYNLKDDPHENTNLVGIAEHEDQLRIHHKKLYEKMKSAGTAPAGIPLISPELQALAKSDNSLIPPLHWPTTDEAVAQSYQQRQRERPDFEGHAEKLKHKGFWFAHAKS